MKTKSERRKMMELHASKKQEFRELFPTERDRLFEIYRLLDIDITKCISCTSERVELCQNDRLLRCHNCGKHRWLTKGTFFEDMKHPTLWLLVIWFILQGIALNANQASKLADAVYSSAFYLFRRIGILKNQQTEEYKATEAQWLAFIDAISKRSRLTPAGVSPTDEGRYMYDTPEQKPFEPQEEVTPEEHNENTAEERCENNREVGSFKLIDWLESSTPEACATKSNESAFDINTLSQDEQELYVLLSETPVSIDVLCEKTGKPSGYISGILILLELAKVAHRAGANHFVRGMPKKPSSPEQERGNVSAETKRDIDLTIDFILDTFEGISWKYLQLYIAHCWFHTNWCEDLQQKFLSALRTTGRIKRDEILAYVTPKAVRLCHPLTTA